MAASRQQQETSTFDAPPYEANWLVDEAHKPETLIDRHSRNAQNPSAAEVYKRAVTEKAEKFGLIHVDPATGYRARFKPQGGDQARSGKPSQAGTGGGQGGDAQAARIADLERQLAEARGAGGGDQ